MCRIIRPASRDQIRCRAVRQRQSGHPSEIFSLTLGRTFRSALRGGAKRLATDAVLLKGATHQTSGQQRTIQSDRLPTYLLPLAWLRSARPSSSSPGKGSDMGANPYLEASRSIFSSQFLQNRHRACRTMQTFTSSKDDISSLTRRRRSARAPNDWRAAVALAKARLLPPVQHQSNWWS